MKSPIDTVTGKIVGYDNRCCEVLIRARYDDWYTMTKREYKTCLVQLVDNRPLSDKQRRMCYALLREIGDYTGMGKDPAKEYMKLKFVLEDMGQTAEQIFSLSNAPMSLVCAFQRFLVHFILDWDIPCRFSLLDYVDDIGDYIYHCLIKKSAVSVGNPPNCIMWTGLAWGGTARISSTRVWRHCPCVGSTMGRTTQPQTGISLISTICPVG